MQEIVELTSSWQQVTSGPVLRLTIQAIGQSPVEMLNKQGSRSSRQQGLRLPPDTALVNRAMSDLFPGEVTPSATAPMWCRVVRGQASVFVSHA